MLRTSPCWEQLHSLILTISWLFSSWAMEFKLSESRRTVLFSFFVCIDSSVITCQCIFRNHCYLLQCISFYLLAYTFLHIFEKQLWIHDNCVSFCSLAFISNMSIWRNKSQLVVIKELGLQFYTYPHDCQTYQWLIAASAKSLPCIFSGLCIQWSGNHDWLERWNCNSQRQI